MNIIPEEYDNICYIVGGGTSLKDFDWNLLKGKFVIAINTSFIKVSDSDSAIIYFTDPPWAMQHMESLKQFKGLIYQGALNTTLPKKLDIVDKQWLLTGVEGLETKEGCLRHGSNSPYAAVGLASVHLGFKKIFLLGIDQKYGKKGDKSTSHWHNDANHTHKRIDPESTFTRMLMHWKTIKQPLLDMGVTVINVNTPEGTALDVFPIQSVVEVFNP